MKKQTIQAIILLIGLCFFGFSSLEAQVTVGSGEKPNKASLLDIKESNLTEANSKRGLALPRVNLTDMTKLYPMFLSGYSSTFNSTHTGLTVYNVNPCDPFGKGIFVWNGSKWEPMGGYPAIYKPATPSVMGKTSICAGESTSLSVTNSDTDYEVKWYNQPSGGTLLRTGNTLNTGVLNTNTSYYVAIEHKSGIDCGRSDRGSITVTVQNPTAPVISTTNVAICGGTTSLNGLVTSSTPAGYTLKWYTSSNVLVALPATVGAGTYYAVYEPTSGTCKSLASANVTVTNLNTLVSSTPTGYTLKWYTSLNAAVSTPTAVGAGTYYAVYEPTTGTCKSPASVNVIVTDTQPSAPSPSTTNINTCGGTANLNSLVSNTPAGYTLKWYTSTNAAVASPTAVGAGTYYAVYEPTTGTCKSPASVNVTVTLNTLVSSTPTGYTLKWYTSLNAAVSTPTAVGAGTYYAVYEPNSGTCKSSASVNVIVTDTKPSAPSPSAMSIEICGGTTTNLNSLVSSTPSGYTLKWYTSSNIAVSTPTTVGAGTYYAVYEPTSGTCKSPASTNVTVTEIDASATPVTVDDFIHIFTDGSGARRGTMTATSTTTGFTTQWYTSSTGGSAIATGNTYSPTETYAAADHGVYTWYVSCKHNVSGCESARVPVRIVVAIQGYGRTSGTSNFDVNETVSMGATCGTQLQRGQMERKFATNNEEIVGFAPALNIPINEPAGGGNTPGTTVTDWDVRYENISSAPVITKIEKAGTGYEVKVIYDTNLNQNAKGLSRSNPLSAYIYYYYAIDAAKTKYYHIRKKINVQDCVACGIIEDVTQKTWKKEYMCHNLGANMDWDPFAYSEADQLQLGGDAYVWGDTQPIVHYPDKYLNYIPDLDRITNALRPEYKSDRDICPDGWTIPSSLETTDIFTDGSVSRDMNLSGKNAQAIGSYYYKNGTTPLLSIPVTGQFTIQANGMGEAWTNNEQSLFLMTSTSDATYFYLSFIRRNTSGLNVGYDIGGVNVRNLYAASIRCVPQ
ncbi:MAG: hypothetical protein E6767_10520 [Dysgonomonas sp.]|nr:hypothetical protein [Dysgonomonas sp.]